MGEKAYPFSVPKPSFFGWKVAKSRGSQGAATSTRHLESTWEVVRGGLKDD